MSVENELLAKDLRHNQAGEPNEVYELCPRVRENWFNTTQIEAELMGGASEGPLRLARYGVHGDGSCAYHTICAGLNIEDYVHQTDAEQKQIAYRFRCSLGEKMKKGDVEKILKKAKGAKSSSLTLTQFQEQLCDPKVWADEVSLRMVGQILDMNLIFLDMDKIPLRLL
jgi:hypothetical protein